MHIGMYAFIRGPILHVGSNKRAPEPGQVSSGLDSLVLGEAQILAQARPAWRGPHGEKWRQHVYMCVWNVNVNLNVDVDVNFSM